jgi:hypothetical protein
MMYEEDTLAHEVTPCTDGDTTIVDSDHTSDPGLTEEDKLKHMAWRAIRYGHWEHERVRAWEDEVRQDARGRRQWGTTDSRARESTWDRSGHRRRWRTCIRRQGRGQDARGRPWWDAARGLGAG